MTGPTWSGRSRIPALAGCIAAGVWLAVYVPDAGHGFIKDDFFWIAQSRVDEGGWPRLLGAPSGFFRPLVGASFALSYAAWGLEPFWYGQTNVLLAVACMASLWWLLSGFGLGARAAVVGALVWGFNFHGVNLGVLWISGRTSLLSTLAVTAAAGAWVRGRTWIAWSAAAAGMLTKEDAFIVPPLLFAWSFLSPDRPDAQRPWPRRMWAAARRTWMLWVAAALCLALRATSDAYTPWSGPDFYRYRLSGSVLLANGAAYIDRAATTSVAAALLVWLVSGCPKLRFGPQLMRLLLWGWAWWLLAVAPTILLPVRSSLYALLPAVGVVVAASAILDLIMKGGDQRLGRRALVALAVAAILASPVLKARNRRLVREADLSTAVTAELRALSHLSGVVVLHDDRSVRPTAEQALGGLATDAARLVSDGHLDLWLEPPPADFGTGQPPPDPRSVVAELAASRGKVERIR